MEQNPRITTSKHVRCPFRPLLISVMVGIACSPAVHATSSNTTHRKLSLATLTDTSDPWATPSNPDVSGSSSDEPSSTPSSGATSTSPFTCSAGTDSNGNPESNCTAAQTINISASSAPNYSSGNDINITTNNIDFQNGKLTLGPSLSQGGTLPGSQAATVQSSVILGGGNNNISGQNINDVAIIGGNGNNIIDIPSQAPNTNLQISASGIFNGSQNNIYSSDPTQNSNNESENNVILGGGSNIVGANSDQNQAIFTQQSAVLGGGSNTVTGTANTVSGGQSNQIINNAIESGIVGGDTNQINGDGNDNLNNDLGSGNWVGFDFIGGGQQNTITSASNAVILGGKMGKISANALNSVIIGGQSGMIGSQSQNALSMLGGQVASNASDAMAIGRASSVKNPDDIAIGHGAMVTTPNSIALGAQSQANRTATNAEIANTTKQFLTPLRISNTDEAAILGSINNRVGIVSVGTINNGSHAVTRQITNVAAGSELTDAVNLGQLEAVAHFAESGWKIAGDKGMGTVVNGDGIVFGGDPNGDITTTFTATTQNGMNVDHLIYNLNKATSITATDQHAPTSQAVYNAIVNSKTTIDTDNGIVIEDSTTSQDLQNNHYKIGLDPKITKQIQSNTNSLNQLNQKVKSLDDLLKANTQRIANDESQIKQNTQTATQANTSAQAATQTAQQANTAAQNADKDAKTAEQTANQANTTAQSANSTAQAANKTAGQANTTAQNADKDAKSAEQTANQANTTAQSANSTAQAANKTAGQANATAQNADKDAKSAEQTANQANTTAQSANSTAQAANKTAGQANATAQNADKDAKVAVQTANKANSTAQAANKTANQANSTAKHADKTANTANNTAQVATKSAEQANKTAQTANKIASSTENNVKSLQGSVKKITKSVNQGIEVSGNKGSFKIPMQQFLVIKGTTTNGNSNIIVTANNKTKTLDVALNKDVHIQNSMTVGNSNTAHTTVNKQGVTISGTHGKPSVTLTAQGLHFKNHAAIIDGVATNPNDDSSVATVGYVKKVMNANSQTNHRLDDLNRRMHRMQKHLRAGIASSIAIGMLQSSHFADQSTVSAAVGGYEDENALAVGYAHTSDDRKETFKAGVSVNTRKEVGYGASFGYSW